MHWLFKKQVLSFTGFFAVMLFVFDLIYRRSFQSEHLASRFTMIIAVWIVYAVLESINARGKSKEKEKKEDRKQGR